MSGNFKYFAYGSNLLKERIQLKNKTAKFISIAKLENYQLAFDGDEEADTHWRGCGATINSCPGQIVWGCMWTLQNDNLASLDKQEGVAAGIYRPIEVEVTTPDGKQHTCRTYEMLLSKASDKRPSPQYLDVIVRGAKQNGLPQAYLELLQRIEHNGNTEKVQVYHDILTQLGESP